MVLRRVIFFLHWLLALNIYKTNTLSQVSTCFCRVQFFLSAVQFLVNSLMDACILYSHVVGARSIAWQLMLWCLRLFIKIETIIGTACHCRMLCDVQTWGLWPLDLSCCTRFVFDLLGCIYPHDKYSFIIWSHFVLFNSYAKFRPGDTPKSDTLPSILVSSAMGWKAYLDLFDNIFFTWLKVFNKTTSVYSNDLG